MAVKLGSLCRDLTGIAPGDAVDPKSSIGVAQTALKPSGMDIAFRRAEDQSGAHVQGTHARAVEVDAQNTGERFHFTKMFYCKDEHGNVNVYSFVVELKGQDLIDAQVQYASIKQRYKKPDKEVSSIDLRHLTVTCKDGTVEDLDAEDAAVVRLRELYDRADYVKGFPQRWPKHREHSHGDLGGNPSLQIASERLQTLSSKWKKDDFLGDEKVQEYLADHPDKRDRVIRRIEKAHEFFEKAPEKIQRMIDAHQDEKAREQNAERKLILEQEILHLQTFRKQILSMNQFAVYSAILLESDKGRLPKDVERDVKILAGIVETLEPPLKSGYLAKVTRAREPKDVTHAEKEHLYDTVLLLGSKTRSEYLANSRLTGQTIKKPVLEEALVGALRHDENPSEAVEKLCHHPMLKDGLKGKFHDEFIKFAEEFFPSSAPSPVSLPAERPEHLDGAVGVSSPPPSPAGSSRTSHVAL